MKLTQKQLLELVKKAGLDTVQLVENDSDSEYNVDTALQAIDTARATILKPKLTQELTDTLTPVIKGRYMGDLRTKMAKKAGIVRNSLEDKELDDIIETVFEAYGTTVGKDKDELRKELDTILSTHAKKLEEVNTKHTKELQAEKEKFVERDIDGLMLEVVNEIPRTKGDDAMRAKALKSYLREMATLKYDEATRKADLRSKDNPELPLLNEGNTQKVDMKELAKDYAKKMGWGTGDMRHENPKDHMKDKGDNYTASGTPNNQPTGVQQLNEQRAKYFEQVGMTE